MRGRKKLVFAHLNTLSYLRWPNRLDYCVLHSDSQYIETLDGR